MTTVKISELPLISQINANTANTLFAGVDIPTSATFRMTAHTLAQGLYSNEILNVGSNPQNLPNTIAQYALSGQSYIQTNLVNTNDGGSADIVVTANTNSGGTDSTNFIDMGYANKYYQPGSEFNNIGTAIYPLDGYLYVQGTASSNGGNLVIGTTTSGTNLRFIVGGGSASNVVAKMTSTGLSLNTQSSITFADGSIQSVAASPANYSQAAFALANTVSASVTYQSGVDLTQNTSITATNDKMQSAYNKANNALANSTGTFSGDLTITGNTFAQSMNTTNFSVVGTANVSGTLNAVGIVSLNAQVIMTNTNFSATQSAVTITATPSVAIPSNDGYMIHISGKQNVSSRIVSDSYGANTYVVYAGRSARGNLSNPTAVQANDILSRFSGNGYGTTGWSQFGSARIDFVATENYTDDHRGSQIQFWNCPVGTNTLTQIASFNGNSATFTGAIIPQKGFIYTPLVWPSSQTAITIDMSDGPLVRAQTAAGLVVTLSNLTAGKETVAWITNTAGTNQTFTHGVSATNSTVNSTTYSIPATSTIMVKYMCVDGTLQNTFVAIIHA